MKKDNRGFTLIEILAAVTILGILSAIAMVSVNKVIQKGKEQHYKTAEKQMELAGQSYVQQNRSSLPKAIGQKTKIPLSILISKNYIEPIKDYNEQECNENDSYVQIFKYSQSDYSYLPHLKCNDVYETKPELIKGTPTIVITDAGTTINVSIEDTEKLLSWSYIIYKSGREVKNSGSIAIPNYDKQIEKTIKLTEYLPRPLKVEVTATNIYGITSKEKISLD